MRTSEPTSFPAPSDGSPDRTRIKAVLGELERVLTLIDGAVAERGHVVGADFTLADMAVLPALTYLADLPESAAMIANRPAVGDYIARHAERPSMRATATPPPGARSPEALAAA